MANPDYATLLASIAAASGAAKTALEQQCYVFDEALTDTEKNLFNYVFDEYLTFLEKEDKWIPAAKTPPANISFFKRKANIKDTGSIIPGHGGLLDRIDGILLGLPLGIILISN